jgi:hypothetical protein
MKITIEIDTDNAAFEDRMEWEIHSMLLQAERKIRVQMERPPALCTHPEAADKLLDGNGNTCGSVHYQEGDGMSDNPFKGPTEHVGFEQSMANALRGLDCAHKEVLCEGLDEPDLFCQQHMHLALAAINQAVSHVQLAKMHRAQALATLQKGKQNADT